LQIDLAEWMIHSSASSLEYLVLERLVYLQVWGTGAVAEIRMLVSWKLEWVASLTCHALDFC